MMPTVGANYPLVAISERAVSTAASFFSLGNKKPRLVSIHAESTGVTGVFEVRPVLEGSGRDADPCQRQLLGPFVLAKNDCLQRTGGEHRRQPVFSILSHASMALCRSILLRV